MDVMAKEPKEAAKLSGVVLMHFGQIRPYGSGTMQTVVEVNTQGLSVKFNIWSSKKKFDTRIITVIVAEAFFVRRVSRNI